MNRINPFENYFDPNKINQAGNVNTPEKIDTQNMPKETEGMQGIGGIQRSSENDFVDTSGMVDDSGDFDMNDFGNDDKSGGVQKAGEPEAGTGQEGTNQGSEDDLEKASDLVNDFLNQRRN